MKVIKDILIRIKEAMSQFAVSFYGSIAIFILATLQVIFEYEEKTILRVIFALAFGVIASIAFQLMSIKYGYSKRADIVQKVVAALFTVPCYFLINNIFESDYTALSYAGGIVFFLLFAIYQMYDSEHKELVFPQIVKSGFFAFIVASLFFGGISLCLLAFDFLVVELPHADKWYMITAFLSYIILFYNLFIALLPKKQDAINIPKIFKVLVLYVGMPIYTLLLAVLYAYLIKILFNMKMPEGQINVFASLASLFFIFFYFDVAIYDNKAVRFFRKFGGWFLFPIIASQAVAIYIRVNAYGLTTARWISIILNVTALAFIIVTLIKQGKFAKYVISGFAVVVILSSIGPLNAIDIPIREQTNRLENILEQNDMFSEGVVIPKNDITESDKQAISSCYDYLKYKDKAPAYLQNDFAFNFVFGFEYVYDYDNGYMRDTIQLNKYRTYETINIVGYSKYIATDAYSNEKFEVVIEGVTYNIEEQIMNIKERTKDNIDDSDMIFEVAPGILFYLTSVYYETSLDGVLHYFSADGFVLIK